MPIFELIPHAMLLVLSCILSHTVLAAVDDSAALVAYVHLTLHSSEAVLANTGCKALENALLWSGALSSDDIHMTACLFLPLVTEVATFSLQAGLPSGGVHMSYYDSVPLSSSCHRGGSSALSLHCSCHYLLMCFLTGRLGLKALCCISRPGASFQKP